jgi:hypothetical protein
MGFVSDYYLYFAGACAPVEFYGLKPDPAAGPFVPEPDPAAGISGFDFDCGSAAVFFDSGSTEAFEPDPCFGSD